MKTFTRGTSATKAKSDLYLDEVLESFVVLLQLFEKADGFVVTAAELAVDLLHLLPAVIRKLQGSNNIQQIVEVQFTVTVLFLSTF